MPAKKLKAKTKPVKKVVKNKLAKIVKKSAVKKPVKAVKKTVKKVEKKVAKKPVKNVVAKKVSKPVKKVAQKIVKKSAPKVVKKIIEKSVKKVAVKVTKKEIKKTGKGAKGKAKMRAPDDKTAARIIAKGKTTTKVKPEAEKVPEKKSEAQKNLIIVKKLLDSRNKVTFKSGDFAVYPSHGVGKITDIERTLVLGQDFSCYLMYFEKEKLTIKIPVNSSEKIGLRHLVSKSQMEEVFSILRSGVKKLKGMWSRRAQEYETKINSGEIMLLAEVLRDLTRDIEDGDRSYSERIIYETAVHRLAAEYAMIYGIEFEEAKEKIISTAKDKLGIEGKINQKDEFDEFDYSKSSGEEDEDEEENDEEEEDDFDYGGPSGGDYDDEDDDRPKKKKKKK